MKTFTWAQAEPNNGASPKVAVVLPGSGYPVEGPLLFIGGTADSL